MKKIIASILAAFFVVLSPFSAYAAVTTESMLMFSMRSTDNGVMTAAAVDDFMFTIQPGYYDMRTDSYSWGSKKTYTSTDGVTNTGGIGVSGTYTPQTCVAVRFTFSDFGSFSEFRTLLGRMNFSLYDSANSSGTRYYMYSDKMRSFSSFADFEWSGTVQNGNTHITSSASSTETISPNSLSNYPSYALYQYILDLSLAPEVPDVTLWQYYTESDNGNKVYNASVDEFTLTYVFYVTDAFYSSSGVFLDNVSDGDPVYFYVYLGNNVAAINGSVYGDSSGISSLGASLQNSISSMGSNISNQVNQVKTQLTNATTTITNKVESVGTTISNEINTMSTEIQSGLSDVNSSITTQTTQLKTSITNLGTTINNKLESVKTSVVNKVSEVKDSVVEVKDSILDLPNKIQEMLLGLIVPDSQTMADKYSEFSGLLEEKLGVIYQIPMMLFDFFDTIVNAATTPQASLTLPAFTLPWIDGTQLTIWNSMEYKIIPDGLEVLSDLIRTVTSMTVVVLTFNSVKQAYERFLRS